MYLKKQNTKNLKSEVLKYFWPQAFQIRNTQPVPLTAKTDRLFRLKNTNCFIYIFAQVSLFYNKHNWKIRSTCPCSVILYISKLELYQLENETLLNQPLKEGMNDSFPQNTYCLSYIHTYIFQILKNCYNAQSLW